MKNNLKAERVKKELTQAQLAEIVQVSRQTIISIESNRYVPSVLLSLKIAMALNIKVEDLFELESED
jgi:putative transcriptional regulator